MRKGYIWAAAKAAHEANRKYCEAIGDYSQPDWEHAPGWQTDSAFAGVKFILANPDAGPDASHASWLQQKIENGWTDFDVSIATPDQMGKIGRLGRYLGRKGLMPNPRTGTVVQPDDIANAIDEVKKGRTEIRMDRDAIIHVRVGTVSFSEEQLLENLESVVSTIVRAKPSGLKGQLIKSATLTSTMGPPVRLEIDESGGTADQR